MEAAEPLPVRVQGGSNRGGHPNMFQGLKLAKVHIMQNSVHKYYTYVFLTCLSELDTSTAFLCTMFHQVALLCYPSQCLSHAGDNIYRWSSYLRPSHSPLEYPHWIEWLRFAGVGFKDLEQLWEKRPIFFLKLHEL